jgi:hypothetical protein
MSDYFNELVNKSKIHPVFAVIKTSTGYRVMDASDLDGAGWTYAPTLTGITGSQITIPAGAKEWSVAVESGSAFVNGLQLNAGTALNGGNAGGALLSGITVGCTGGRALIYYAV